MYENVYDVQWLGDYLHTSELVAVSGLASITSGFSLFCSELALIFDCSNRLGDGGRTSGDLGLVGDGTAELDGGQ